MNTMLEMVFDAARCSNAPSANEQDLKRKICKNHALLSEQLSKKQKKTLLRIIDDNGLLVEETAMGCFELGFKMGVKLGLALEKTE